MVNTKYDTTRVKFGIICTIDEADEVNTPIFTMSNVVQNASKL